MAPLLIWQRTTVRCPILSRVLCGKGWEEDVTIYCRIDSSVQRQNGKKCSFLGLPGNPVSSAVTFLLFAAPILAALAGRLHRGPRFALARLTEDVKTKPGLTRFLPAACTFAAPVPEVACVSWQGSGDLAAMALANCYLVVPEDSIVSRQAQPSHSSTLRSTMSELSHFNSSGQPSMVDIGGKQPARRTATASAFVALSAAVVAALPRTPRATRLKSRASPAFKPPSAPPSSFPLCHPLALTHVDVETELVAGGVRTGVRIRATAAAVGPTGVEMEALTAAAVAALTVYDMTKALDKAIVIRELRLESKTGGKKRDFSRPAS